MQEIQFVERVLEDEDADREVTVSAALVATLRAHGCRRAFGILGGAALPLFDALVRGGLEPIHFRHESGAVFAAIEHELAGGGPTIVFTTTGPGLTNALTGVMAARSEGARLIVISAATGPDRRGRRAFQETSATTLGNTGLLASGGWFDYAVSMQSAAELPVVLARLGEGLTRRSGFVAHVSLPPSMQAAKVRLASLAATVSTYASVPSPQTLARCVDELGRGPVCVWLGFGARHASSSVRALVNALDASVISSPRGKGIFPESDPRFCGVTGFGGHDDVFRRLASARPRITLVLGSRLGEFTSFWDARLVAPGGLIHVDVDPTVFGSAYPEVPTLGVAAEVGGFVDALLARLPRRRMRAVHAGPLPAPVEELGSGVGVGPRALMAGLQRVVVSGSDVPVLTEAGNAFVWTTHCLSFDAPGRYRASMGFGSMGHASAGVIGAALARGGPALAVVGDGAMLMTNEISTAVSIGAPAIWVVLNDARYGLVADGMQALGYAPFGLDFHRVDFAALAHALGADGIAVHHEADIDAALARALASGRPFVVDVHVDTSQPAPFGARNRSLAHQAAGSGLGGSP